MVQLILQNWWLRYSILGALFLLVAIVVYLMVSSFDARKLMRERLASDHAAPLSPTDKATIRLHDREGLWLKLVTAIENSGLSLADTKDEALRARLVAAGYREGYAPRAYVFLRLALVVSLPLLVLLMFWMRGAIPGAIKLYAWLVGAALFGLYIPALFVRARADRRKKDIINGFPDALDLLLVCVEAGLGLEAAMGRVGMEVIGSHPLLSEQFGTVVLELRAGRSREDALRRMADRSGVEEIGSFATLLIQSTKLGTSIGQTLRIYAAEMREKRRMRAEEKAHRLPVLLSIPLVACMLPVMIGVLMLPAVIRVIRAVGPALYGGG